MVQPFTVDPKARSVVFDLDIERASKEIRKKIGQANKRAAKIVHAEALARAPVGPTGNLKKDIKVKKGRKTSKAPEGDMDYKVVSLARHSLIVSWGTVPRTNKSGANRGSMPANPFMRDAADAKRGQALREYDGIL